MLSDAVAPDLLRVAAQGSPASKQAAKCSRCTAQLSKLSGKPHWFKGKRVCHKCYMRERRGAETSVAVAAGAPRVASPPPPGVSSTPRRTISAPLQLTPEQTEHLRNTVKAAGLGQQGRTRTQPETARAILQVSALMNLRTELSPSSQRVLSFDQAVKTTSKAEMMSPTTLRQSIKRYEKENQLAPPPPKRLKRDDPLHSLFGEYEPPLEVEREIHQRVDEARQLNLHISVRTLRANVLSVTGKDVPPSTMKHWLHQLGIEHGEKKLTGLKAEYSRALIRRYILQYSKLAYKERQGKHVLVWMDESYIHAGYCSRFSWYRKTDDIVPNKVRGQDKGKRMIIMHAMTRDGMLEKLGPNDLEPSDNLDEKCASAAIVTTKLSAEGCEPADYHDTLDGDKFLQWMRNRLLPAFEKKYGKRKKMVLILDNAKYHHARGEDWVSASKMSKTELGVFLRTAGVPSITREDGVAIPASKFTADVRGAAGGGPSKELLQQVVKDYIASHPTINSTLVAQLMQEKKHELVYTPPYESWLQPIELVWAQVKMKVAQQARTGRRWQETAEQTRTALREMTPKACSDIIRHTEVMMDEWLKTSAAGSLKGYGSIEQLGRLSPEERDACQDLDVPASLLTGDDDAEHLGEVDMGD